MGISVRKIIIACLGMAAPVMLVSGVAAASAQYQTGSTGVDVSYPNCTAKIPAVSFGIVGVENGLGFSQNSCAKQEAAHFPNLSLYANTGYPGSGSANAQKYKTSPRLCADTDLNCIAYDYGYNQGLYAYNYASSQNISSPTWWLDVETVNTWIGDTTQNQNSLQGQHDALVANGAAAVGVYSTTAMWNSITGTWKNNWPSWGATTWTTANQAQTYCTGHQFTGGPSLLMQFKSKKSPVDQDVAC